MTVQDLPDARQLQLEPYMHTASMILAERNGCKTSLVSYLIAYFLPQNLASVQSPGLGTVNVHLEEDNKSSISFVKVMPMLTLMLF